MGFDSWTQQDAQLFASAELFGGETVTYTPKGGMARTINVVVYRQEPSAVAPTSHPAPETHVFIPYSTDPTKGTTSVNKGGDTIRVSDREGGEAFDRVIASIINQDAGGWLVKLR